VLCRETAFIKLVTLYGKKKFCQAKKNNLNKKILDLIFFVCKSSGNRCYAVRYSLSRFLQSLALLPSSGRLGRCSIAEQESFGNQKEF
jgi:hypothetical protein